MGLKVKNSKKLSLIGGKFELLESVADFL